MERAGARGPSYSRRTCLDPRFQDLLGRHAVLVPQDARARSRRVGGPASARPAPATRALLDQHAQAQRRGDEDRRRRHPSAGRLPSSLLRSASRRRRLRGARRQLATRRQRHDGRARGDGPRRRRVRPLAAGEARRREGGAARQLGRRLARRVLSGAGTHGAGRSLRELTGRQPHALRVGAHDTGRRDGLPRGAPRPGEDPPRRDRSFGGRRARPHVVRAVA